VDPETDGRNVGLVAVLLEAHPLEHAGVFEPIHRQKGRVVGQVVENGVRLREALSVLELEQGDLPVRVHPQKIGRTRFAFDDVHLDALEVDSELRE
jgi:hypothetical protein